jgi:hypothetical protein
MISIEYEIDVNDIDIKLEQNLREDKETYALLRHNYINEQFITKQYRSHPNWRRLSFRQYLWLTLNDRYNYNLGYMFAYLEIENAIETAISELDKKKWATITIKYNNKVHADVLKCCIRYLLTKNK